MSTPPAAPFADERRNEVVVFGPEQAVFAGVRVQARDGDARLREAESRHGLDGERHDIHEPLTRQRGRHRPQRDVHGGQHDVQGRRVKEHRHARRAAEFGEQLRVPRPRQSREREPFLADGRRGDGVEARGLRVADGRDDGLVSGPPSCRRDRSERDAAGRDTVHRARRPLDRAVEQRDAGLEHANVAGRQAGDFRADARGIAHRDAHSRQRRPPLHDPQDPQPAPHPAPAPEQPPPVQAPPEHELSWAHPAYWSPLALGSS